MLIDEKKTMRSSPSNSASYSENSPKVGATAFHPSSTVSSKEWHSSFPTVKFVSSGQEDRYLLYKSQDAGRLDLAPNDDDLRRALIQQAQNEGYAGLIGLSQSDETAEQFRRLDFKQSGLLVLRRRYLKLLPFVKDNGLGSIGFRALAQFSNNIRHRIVEADLNDDAFATMARIYERSLQKTNMTMSVHRSVDSLREKYRAEKLRNRYVLFLRKDVGAKTDSYIVFNEYTDEREHQIMVIEDFWTSREGRREFAWLVTEACIWALGHGFYSVDDWTVKGSREYSVSRALGAVKQQSTLCLFTQVFPGFPAIDFSSGHFRYSDFSNEGDGDICYV